VPAYRTRYAPSPTGRLHLGHARTHLLTWLRARREGGTILMRIEDLDPPRVRPGAELGILRDHEWLGLDWDEGPIRQSERLELYAQALERLRARHAVYPCTCSRKELRALASAPHEEQGEPYPGLCREGITHPGRAEALRMRMPEPSPGFSDALMGSVAPGAVRGDFVIRRSDGLWAYQLAVVVDDADAAITEIVRGEDLLLSTPRQLALFDALGEPRPGTLHLPLVRDAEGRRLAKRSGAISIEAHREAGHRREAILGALGFSLGLLEAPREATLEELLEHFALDRVPTRSIELGETALRASANPSAAPRPGDRA